MSLVPCVTNANPSLSLLGGGGGGGGSNVPVQYASTIFTSSINAPGPTDPISIDFVSISTLAGITSVANGLSFQLGGIAEFTGSGQINFTDNQGQISGVSTINGAPFPPVAISTITTGGGYFPPGTPVPLNPIPAPVQPNKWYMASVEITDMTFLPAPAATDCFNISIEDATQQINLGTFNMAQVSTNRGVLGDMGFSVAGPYESLSTNAHFVYRANAGAPSTFTVTGGTAWLSPLN